MMLMMTPAVPMTAAKAARRIKMLVLQLKKMKLKMPKQQEWMIFEWMILKPQ